MLCDDRSVSTHGGTTYPRVRTVAMNCWLAEGRLSQSPGYRVFKKSTDLTVPGPSRTWVLMDEREDSIDDAYFAVNMTGYPDAPRTIIWVNYPASYHGNSAGLVFADGHSEIKRWRDPRTMPALAARPVAAIERLLAQQRRPRLAAGTHDGQGMIGNTDL